MSAYVIVDITIRDATTYEAYKELAPPSIAKYGGRYVIRGGTTKVLEGGWTPNRFVMLEFASAERAEAWWGSPEYAKAKALRQSCSSANMILVEGPSLDPAAA